MQTIPNKLWIIRDMNAIQMIRQIIELASKATDPVNAFRAVVRTRSRGAHCLRRQENGKKTYIRFLLRQFHSGKLRRSLLRSA